MEGWIKLRRTIKGHWIYPRNRAFTEYEAFVDILMEVNHKDSKVMIQGSLIDCKRGQSLKSLDSWAKAWSWNKSKVRRFFELLKNDSIIDTENVNKTTRLTVCNYDIYQGSGNDDETQSKRIRNANGTRATPNKNEKNEKNIIEECQSFISTYGQEMINDFIRHWTEKDKKGKEKWQKQETWETSKRLATWKKKSEEFKKPYKQTPTQKPAFIV